MDCMNLREARSYLKNKTEKCDALRAKAGKFARKLATLRNAPKMNDKKIADSNR